MSKIQWDKSVDILVVGSGAGALTAALKAAHLGAEVLVIEKAPHFGGTSATSGGGLWVPCNHLMRDAGIEDNRDAALQYLLSLTGGDVPRENVEAYVDNGHRMLEWLCRESEVEYIAMPHYADYYQELPGARPGGRSIDPVPYDARLLSEDHFLSMQEPHRQTRVLGLMGYSNVEGAVLLSKSPGWFKLVAELAWEYFTDLPWRFRSRRSRRLTMGNALMGRLRKSLVAFDVPIWLQTPASELIQENGAVVGVRATRDGKPFFIRARKGVLCGSGGFEHNQALREQHLPKPTCSTWSAAHPHNTGDLLIAGQRIGAATALLNQAWWGPSIVVQGEDRARALFSERSMPGAILVNKSGRRFVNESVAYTTAVQAMYQPGNLPTYLIFDSRYKQEYPFGPLLPGGMYLNWLLPSQVRRDLLLRADTIIDLARLLDVPGERLMQTVAQFNKYAESGKDEEFHRGESSYDLIYGDVRIGPNSCLAPIIEPPFYAIEVHPGDIGTKGGCALMPMARSSIDLGSRYLVYMHSAIAPRPLWGNITRERAQHWGLP